MACCEVGDEALLVEPFYTNYRAFAAMGGIDLKPIVTRAEDGFHLPAREEWEKALTPKTKAVLLCNPNNPTGAVYSTEARRALVELADENDLVLLADEVYADLAYDAPVPPIGALDPDAPVISFSSISKAYRAPGWRAGWLAVSGGERLNPVLRAINELADGRLCSTGPMQHAILGR